VAEEFDERRAMVEHQGRDMTTPDKNKFEKLRDIGARFVETCATCEHGKQIPHEHDGEMLRRWGSCSKHTYAYDKRNVQTNLPANVLMSCNDYQRRDSYMLLLSKGLSKSVPVRSTTNLNWTICPHCTWKGWGTQLILHELSTGDVSVWSWCCPTCGAELMQKVV